MKSQLVLPNLGLPLAGQNCSFENSMDDKILVSKQRRGSSKKQKQKKIKNVNNSEPVLGEGRA